MLRFKSGVRNSPYIPSGFVGLAPKPAGHDLNKLGRNLTKIEHCAFEVGRIAPTAIQFYFYIYGFVAAAIFFYPVIA